MASIRLEGVHQVYGSFHALKQIDLSIREGEFFSLLGPSGSGKTTLLRLIAGFEPPHEGEIHIGDDNVTFLPPEKRRVGMVFQNYALFPHLNVFDNVAYGLRAAKKSKDETRKRVGEMLDLVELSGLENRDVHALSGGQQQRVALARAVAPYPRVLLMDEPLSNLDARLRLQTRLQIRDLQRRLGMTTVYVTHDQSEALSLSDRVGVILEGRIARIGSPQEAYRNPRSIPVAEFLGEMNFIPAQVVPGSRGDGIALEILGNKIEDLNQDAWSARTVAGAPLLAGLRPEAFGPPGLFAATVEVAVRSVQYEGNTWRLEAEWNGRALILSWPSAWTGENLRAGEKMTVSFDPSSVSVFSEEGF